MGPRRRLFQLGIGSPSPRRAVDWEIEHHLAEQTELLVEEGWDRPAARREAERRFGDLVRHRRKMIQRERHRRMSRKSAEWGDLVRSLWSHAFRSMVRSPGLLAAVVLTLGLGIGVNTIMFSVLDRLLLQPPGQIQNPDQVRRILVDGALFGDRNILAALTYPDVEDLRSMPEFAGVGAVSSTRTMTLGRGPDATRARVARATFDFFSTLGVSPLVGRFFQEDEDRIGAPATVVVSEGFWERAFGRDPELLGRSLEVDGERFTVIGITPRGFTGMDLSPVDMWLPALTSRYLQSGNDSFLTSRGSYWLKAVVRMAEGASPEAAESRATALHLSGRQDRIDRGSFDPETYVLVTPLIESRGPTASATSRTALWLGGVSLMVLLIACANVANLLLAQASRRRRETAIRLSLGASRPRLLTEMVVGGLLLSGLGGVAALGVAFLGGNVVRTLVLPDIVWGGGPVGPRTLGVTILLSILAGLLAGVGPAVQSTRRNLAAEFNEGSRGGTHRRSRFRTALTVVQAAMSVVLLVGAGLFIRSLAKVRDLDLGLDVDRLTLAILETHSNNMEALERNLLYQEAMDRVAHLPGVAGVAATDVPFQWYMVADLQLPGVDSLPIPRGVGPLYYSVTPGYMETLGLDILQGRTLQETDQAGAPKVAVVNERMARALWPDGDALGSCFYFNEQEECTTVVGIVENTSVGEIEENPWLAYYLPLEQTGFGIEGMYVRSEGDPAEVASAVRPVLRSFSPAVRYADVQPLRQVMASQSHSWALGATLFSAFGVLALLVATIGLYSVLAFEVVQRTREIGIRSALGAPRSRVLRGVMGDGGRIAGFGCFLGLGTAFLVAPLAQPLLFHVQARDPLVLWGVGVTLVAVAALSSLLPAIRATRVNPLEALREE